MKDKLIKAIQGNIRIVACFSTNTTTEMQARHNTYPVCSAALGRLTTAAALMGSLLKQNQKVLITVNGDGPAGTLMAESDNLGNVRSFISNPFVDIPPREDNKLNVGGAIGHNGELKVIKDLNMKEPFTGVVPLQDGELGYDLTYYFAVSEQTPSVVSLGVFVGEDNKIKSSGGLLIQLLPGHTEDEIKYIESIVSKIPPMSEAAEKYGSVQEFIAEYFKDAKIIDESEFEFNCTCSIDKMKNAIALLPKEERDKTVEDNGCIEIKCNFCNITHKFNGDIEIIK